MGNPDNTRPNQGGAMGRFRIALRVVLAIVLLGGLAGGAAFYFSQGAVRAADDFFTTLATTGPEATFQKTSAVFREAQTASDFSAWAQTHHLSDFRSANWNSRSISGSKAELSGTLELKNGASLPATMTLTKNDQGIWQVVFVDVPPTGVAHFPGAAQ
jgi:hypothetical protein